MVMNNIQISIHHNKNDKMFYQKNATIHDLKTQLISKCIKYNNDNKNCSECYLEVRSVFMLIFIWISQGD